MEPVAAEAAIAEAVVVKAAAEESVAAVPILRLAVGKEPAVVRMSRH